MYDQISPQHILIIKLSAFGDFIRSLNQFAAIRALYPHAKITCMTTKPFVGLAEKSGYCDEVWVVPRWKIYDIPSWWAFRKRIKQSGIDAVYDLQMNDRTLMMRLFAPKRARENWPYRKGNKWRCRPAMPTRYNLVLFQDFPHIQIKDMMWLDADISRYNIPSPYVVLVPGCAPQHPEKRWPARHYGALARMLIDAAYHVVVIGTSDEAGHIAQIAEIEPRIINLCNQTNLYEIAGLGRHAYAAIGNDTGPMHMLSMVGCPVVSLFSFASNPKQSAPAGDICRVLRADPISDITVDQVFYEFKQLFK